MYESVLMIMGSGGNDRFVFGTRVFLSTVIFLAGYDNGFAKRNFCPTAVLSHGLRQSAFDIFFFAKLRNICHASEVIVKKIKLINLIYLQIVHVCRSTLIAKFIIEDLHRITIYFLLRFFIVLRIYV